MELAEQLDQLLADPAQMNALFQLAQSFLGSGPASADGPSSPNGPNGPNGPGEPSGSNGPEAPGNAPPPAPDPGQLLQLAQQLQSAKAGAPKQQALLEALKPFVSPAHQKRLARALQLAQLSKMAGLALQTLEQENDT